jgi:hypothetical protein
MESAAAPPSQSEQGCELARARRPALREADTRAPVVATTGGGVRPGVVPNGGPQSRHGAPKPAASSACDAWPMSR